MQCPVKNLDNQVIGEVSLLGNIFGLPVRKDILSRVIHWQMARARQGTHQAKGISDISGTTRKPYRQKGTGRARQGSLRSPQFRGGAVIFGPLTRDHGYKLPKKIRQLGLKTVLSQKFAAGELMIIKDLKCNSPKAQELEAKLKSMGISSALFIDGNTLDHNFQCAARNLMYIAVLPQEGANVLSILKRKMLVLSEDAVHHLEARLK